MVGTGVPLHGLVVSAGCGTVLWRAGACGDRAGGIAGAVARWSGGCLRCAAAECGVAGADDGGGAERDAACCAPSAGGAACWCGLMERWPAPGCLVQPLFAACRLMVAASLLPCLLSCLASPRVKIGGMRAGGAGLRRMRAVWGLHPGRPCSAGACVPEPRGSAAPCKGGLDPRRGQATLVVCRGMGAASRRPAGLGPLGPSRRSVGPCGFVDAPAHVIDLHGSAFFAE